MIRVQRGREVDVGVAWTIWLRLFGRVYFIGRMTQEEVDDA